MSTETTINLQTLVETVATSTDTSKKVTEAIVRAALQSVADAVAAGNKVTLPNFGIFTRTETVEKQGRNPRTGDAITIPASYKVTFKPSSVFKDLVKGA